MFQWLPLGVALLGGTLLASAVSGQEPCQPTSSQLCLNEGRFQVEVSWRDFQDKTGSGQVVLFGSDDSGVFWFFDGENWEMLVKVLNGCGLNDHFWVFSAATTNVEYSLLVTDTLTGATKSYFNPLGTRADAITDTEALAGCTATDKASLSEPAAPIDKRIPPVRAPGPQGPCSPGATTFCLNDDRFAVEVDWRDFAGNTGSGRVVPISSEDSGLFWFFSDQNWEMLVKVLDGCALNNRFWVFAAATTNVEYTLRVTDTVTGMTSNYYNPLGKSSPAITDTAAFATCGAVSSGLPTLRFVSDQSVILSQQRSEAGLEVEVVDGAGQLIPGAEVTWSSDAPELFSVTRDSRLTAVVKALGQAPAYGTVTARYGDQEARATVLVATPAASTVLIDSRRVLARDREEILLERTPATEALVPGQIVVSGDLAGVLARIGSVSPETAAVRLQVASASLAEAFEELEVRTEGEALELRVRLGDKQSYLERYNARGQLVARSWLDDIECEFENNTPAPVEVRGGSVELRPRLRLESYLSIVDYEVRHFLLGFTGSVELTGTTGSVEFRTDVGGSVECSLEVGDFSTPGLPLSVLTLSLNFPVTVGVEASADFDGPSFKITGPWGRAGATLSAGIRYTPTYGWETYKDQNWGGELQPMTLKFKPDFEFDASAGPFGKLEAGILVDVGRGILSFNLADFRFAEIKGSGAIELGMKSPLDPGEPAYTGPRWSLGLALDGKLKAELSGGILAEVLEYLGVDTDFGADLNLFNVPIPLASSPGPDAMEVVTSRTSCTERPELRVDQGENALFRTTDQDADLGIAGRAEFWGNLSGSTPLATLATGPFRRRSGEAPWTPAPTASGTYRVYPRLVVDPISRAIAPYGGGPEVFAELTLVAGDGVPVIETVDPPEMNLGDGQEAEAVVSFRDSDAGVNWIQFDLVTQDCPEGCDIELGGFDPGVGHLTEGTFSFLNQCSNPGTQPFTLGVALTLRDCQGNTSEEYSFTATCSTDVITLRSGDAERKGKLVIGPRRSESGQR